jgi:DNA-binding response OmpR family regulator
VSGGSFTVSTKCRVLCVDDHIDTGVMLTYLLGNSNFEVETADTIEAALALAESRIFDLYILDKRFPDGTGIELCRRLRTIVADAAIIFYTGDAYQLHRDEALAAGADAFVAKPAIDLLIKEVNALLEPAGCTAVV